jgi:F420-0:Gamma-glutamyl ligase
MRWVAGSRGDPGADPPLGRPLPARPAADVGRASAFRLEGEAGLSGGAAVLPAQRDDVVPAPGGGVARPLYAGVADGGFRFAGSLAELLSDPAVNRVVDPQRVRDYLRGRPGGEPEATLLRGVRRLSAGPSFIFDGNVAMAGGRPVAVALRADGTRGTNDLPTSVQFLAELPEAVRALEQPLPELTGYLRWRGSVTDSEPDELLGRWLRARRAQVQGIFRSPGFCARPFWDGLEVADGFRRACARRSASMDPFWRALNVELWLRCFVDRPRARLRRAMTDAESTALGDRSLRTTVPVGSPHAGRHLAMVGRDRASYLRLPVRTRNVWPGDRLHDVVDEGLSSCSVPLHGGDVLVVAEKIVAIGQGRVVLPEDVEVHPFARVLARFTLRTPAGISLGLPESFELAVREAGWARILAGAAAAAVTRPLGLRGLFYVVAGWEVAAIDSPDADALPPSDRCIKLAPEDPEGSARRLADHVSRRVGARIEAAVVDVNDIGAEVLGASSGVDRRLLVSLLRDNPLGQDVQTTPLGIVRRVDERSGR